MTLTTLIAELEEAKRAVAEAEKKAFPEDAMSQIRLSLAASNYYALMRTHLPTLIEAVKRQGEALELVQQNVEASGSSYQERVEAIGRVVRAALQKESTDV